MNHHGHVQAHEPLFKTNIQVSNHKTSVCWLYRAAYICLPHGGREPTTTRGTGAVLSRIENKSRDKYGTLLLILFNMYKACLIGKAIYTMKSEYLTDSPHN